MLTGLGFTRRAQSRQRGGSGRNLEVGFRVGGAA
jgi:hypothetical protein